jgi:hypothetical protein
MIRGFDEWLDESVARIGNAVRIEPGPAELTCHCVACGGTLRATLSADEDTGDLSSWRCDATAIGRCRCRRH